MKKSVNLLGGFLSVVMTAATLTTGALAMNLITAFSPLTSAAEAADCNPSFSGQVQNYTVNIRAGRSTSDAIIRKVGPNVTLQFQGWEYGQSVNDLWYGKPDNKWFKLKGENAWAASAVIWGNPPAGSVPLSQCATTPSPPSGGGVYYRNFEGFINFAVGRTAIERLDPQTWDSRGQCVTLIARYIQEVYLTGSDRTKNYAFGNGKDTANVVANLFSQYFQPATNQGLPKRGAVISFPQLGGGYGHTAIVMESKTLSNGQRQVRIMDSNGDNRAPNTKVQEYYARWINIPNGTANGYGNNIYWTNPR